MESNNQENPPNEVISPTSSGDGDVTSMTYKDMDLFVKKMDKQCDELYKRIANLNIKYGDAFIRAVKAIDPHVNLIFHKKRDERCSEPTITNQSNLQVDEAKYSKICKTLAKRVTENVIDIADTPSSGNPV